MIQFSLRTLFIITAASAVMFGALYAPPQWLGLLAIYLLYFLLAACAVSGTVFHRGYWQAFFIGVVPWAVLGSLMIVTQFIGGGPSFIANGSLFRADSDELIAFKIALSIPLLLAITSGGVAVCVRWWAVALQQGSE